MSGKKEARQAKARLHHDDPPCSEPLEDDGSCASCGLHPDTQSTSFHLYCPDCYAHLDGTVCPTCLQAFLSPFKP